MKKSKLLLPITAFALLFSLGLAACNNGGGEGQKSSQTGQTERITITAAEGKKDLILGDTVQLTASVQGVTWASKNPEVATVDQNGLVTSKAVGSATITASKDGYKDGSISIKVDLERITITAADNKTSLLAGESVQLTASQQGVTWESSDPEVASVNNGLVTAIKFGTVDITAKKDGFNPGTISISVVRPAASLNVDLTTGADHYSADGWWELPSSGGMMFAMQEIEGFTPIAQQNSWMGGGDGDKFIGGFGEGDKETVKFSSSKAGKAEFVLNIGNTDAAVLAEYMTIKLNGTAIDLAGIELEAHAGDYGNSLAFGDVSLGELDIAADNTLVFEMTAANSLYLNELTLYAGDAVLTLVNPDAKEQIAVKAAALEVIVDETVQIESDETGLSYLSVDETIATVDENGLVTGVKVGKTNITVKKEGMYSIRVEITVNPKPVAGQILVEAEDGEEVTDSMGGDSYYKQADNSQWGGSGVHSGGAYVSYFSMGGGDVDLTLTIKFQAPEKKVMVLSVVGSAPVNFMGGESAAYVFADSATLSINGNEVAFADQEFPAPQGYTAEMVEIVLGDVEVESGENTLVFNTKGAAPSLDVFKLSLKA